MIKSIAPLSEDEHPIATPTPAKRKIGRPRKTAPATPPAKSPRITADRKGKGRVVDLVESSADEHDDDHDNGLSYDYDA